MPDDRDKKTQAYGSATAPLSERVPKGDEPERPAGFNEGNGGNPSKRFTWPVVAQVIFDGILAVATIWYVVYAGGQLHALKRTLVQTHRLADISEKQIRYSERPWIGIGGVDIVQPLRHGQVMRIKVAVSNSGRSPGIHVFGFAVLKPWRIFLPQVSELPFADELPECQGPQPKWRDDLGGTIVIPGSTTLSLERETTLLEDDDVDEILAWGSPTPSPTSNQTPTASPDAMRTPTVELPPIPRMGTLKLMLVRCVNYFDQFHAAHRTTFCDSYDPKPEGIGSPSGTFLSVLKAMTHTSYRRTVLFAHGAKMSSTISLQLSNGCCYSGMFAYRIKVVLGIHFGAGHRT